MTGRVQPADVKRMLHDGGEIALLDVREVGAHSQGHPFYAAPLPLSRLELLVVDLVPRRSTRIVLIDDGTDLADRAAATLAAMAYTDVAILEGGAPAWRRAGFILFSGVHVPSKAFGEYVEHHYRTPHISAEELDRLMGAGADLVVLDSRPMDEYRVMNIPGSIDVPGAELAYRVHDIVPDPNRLIVVNCAGRTRSIIGAQSLINAGLPNRIAALKDGTMGWHLAGLSLEHGSSRRYGDMSPEALERAQARAAAVRRRFGIPAIDHATLEEWQVKTGVRSTFLLDVRSEEEYNAGHLPGSISAPGGQLVQETETWMATLGARIALIDDTGVRASMTASWLAQMGWDVAILDNALVGVDLETGPRRPIPPSLDAASLDEMSPQDLAHALRNGRAAVIDLALSRTYKVGHIPGAWFAVRARLASSLPKLPRTDFIVLTSPDGTLAKLAAPEASTLTATPIKVLTGGTEAWTAAGFEVETGLVNMADQPDDVWLKPYDHGGAVEKHMQAYLAWEVDLLKQVEEDGDHRFRLFTG